MRFSLLLLSLALWAGPGHALPDSDEKAPSGDIDKRVIQAEQLFEQGHTAESKQICESVLRTLSDRPSAQLGQALNVMSKIYASEGDYDRAIDSARRSADTFEQIHDFSGEAHALNNKGIAELQNGTYAPAQQDLEKALALSEKEKDFENQVQVLNNLGSAYYFQGRYSEAMRGYEAAMALVNSNVSAKWSEYWLQITRFNQATLLQRLGRYDRALHIYRQVEASSKGLTPGDRAHLLANLGTLYRRLGDPYKALDAYLAAQRLYDKQHDADGELAVLKNIGIAYALDLEDFRRAASIFRSAIVLAEKTHNRREEMQAHLYLGETLYRARNLEASRHEFELAETLADQLASTEEQWKSVYGLGRVESSQGNLAAAEGDYRKAIARIEQSRSQLQLSALRAEFFADKREAYDALISLLMGKKDVNEAFLFLEKSRARNFQDRMQNNQLLTLQQAQASLPAGVALLEFWTAGDQIGLIWYTRETAGLTLKQFTPEQQGQIQEALRNIPDSLQPAPNSGVSRLDVILPERWPLPPGVQHLLIVPDAWISYVPFDLLSAGGDSRTVLIEHYDISYLPSAALLRRTSPIRHPGWPWQVELAAFGDPVVTQADPSGDQTQGGKGTTAQSLPYSATETRNIAGLTRGRSQLFLQREDSKKEFLNPANRAPILHVSSHAFADGNNPENSRLLFSSDSANSEPVYVYLRELYDLDLSRVNLATISACDTERGKIIRGEGVQAFSRALLSAGAETSVTTLWRVDDQATAEFMKQFYYFLLRENKPKAEALQLAKLKFLHSKSNLENPAVWAAFVLEGDGLRSVPRVFSWAELGGGALALVAILIISLWALRSLVLRSWSRRGRHGQHHTGTVVPQ